MVRTEKSSRAAVGTGPRLTALRSPGSAQGGAKEKVRPGPWQSRRGSLSLWASRVPGRPCAGGSERGQVRKGGGSQSGGWDPATGGTGTGRSERTAGVTEERRPPRGAPLGNKLQDHSSERRKKSPCCFPSGCGRPACANPAFAPGEPGGRRPAPPPPPPPRLGVSLL